MMTIMMIMRMTMMMKESASIWRFSEFYLVKNKCISCEWATVYVCDMLWWQVLVWKTNFDKSDYNEVLVSHKARSRSEQVPPTIEHIPPRSMQPSTSVSKVIWCLQFVCVVASLKWQWCLLAITIDSCFSELEVFSHAVCYINPQFT